MKNEPTHLEIFQRERIKALEEEVARLNGLLEDKAQAKRVSVIDIRDPVFDKPVTRNITQAQNMGYGN